MYKVGISTCGGKPMDKKAFTDMKSAGIDAIEISRDDYNYVDLKQIKANADAVGIELFSIHSQKDPRLDISSLDREKNKLAVREFSLLIDRISEIGMGKIVLHPTHTPEPFNQSERGEKIKHAMECLDKLAEYGYSRGVEIALENLPRTCLCNTLDEHLLMLSANDKLKACFDLNHLLLGDAVKAINTLGKRIITIHVSDRDNVNERHWMPGEGVLDWIEIIDAFQNIAYTGAWIYEVGFSSSSTIKRRPLTYSDFVTNAREIFAKKEITVIGTPVPNLGMWSPI